jgi:TetR/AcrR family transcriptional repressor of nem operon
MARPREFDREEALHRAMSLFWAKGYEATSIEDLVTRMGIQRGSLYGAFGDKRALFRAALERYQQVVARELFDALAAPGSGLAAIRRFFHLRVERALGRSRPPGCLMTNSAAALSRRDRAAAREVCGSLARLEQAFLHALTRARVAGELSGSRDLRALARFLTSSAQGLSVMAKAFPERAILEDVVSVVLAAIEPERPAPRRKRAGKEVS